MFWPLSFALAAGACLPVEGQRILLRDLAMAIPAFSNAPSEESIGFSPAPGSQRRFSAGEVSRLAEHYAVATDSRAVCFERNLEPLTEQRLADALHEALTVDAHVEIVDFSKIGVPKGHLEFPREGLLTASTAAPHEPRIWRGRVTYAPAQSVPVWVKARIWTSRSGVEAARNLPLGRPIETDDLKLGHIDVGPFGDGPVPSIEEVIGLSPRRLIRAGQPISRLWLETPHDVMRGEMVGIEARYGAASLKYEVRAEATGRVGDFLDVRNLASGKIFRARVIRKGWVSTE